MHWFRDDFRKVLMVYTSPAWATERGARFDAQACLASLQAAQVCCLQVFAKDHYGNCYFPCSLGKPYPVDVVGQLAAEAQKRNMRFIPYVSVGFDAFATGMNPDWLYIDSDGRPRSTPTGPFQWACLNSPYRDYCLQQMRELVDHCRPDGLWLDILPLRPATVGVDGRPGLSYIPDAPCYCPTCQRLWRERYGQDVPLFPTQNERVLGFQMRVDGARSFVEEVQRIVKARRPDAIVTYNGSGKPIDAIERADLSSVEAHAPDYMKTSFFSRWGRHSGHPTEIYTPCGLPGSGLGFNGWDLKPVEMLELETAIAMSQGAVLWLVQNPYPDGSTDQAQYDLLAHVFNVVKTLEPYCRDAEPVSDVALIMTNRPYAAPTYGHESTQAVEAMLHALIHEHIQFDMRGLPAHLSAYRMIILAEQTVMSDEDAEAIRRFVSDGGCLLATGAPGLLDDEGALRSDFALADVLGAHFTRYSQQPFLYLRLTGEAVGNGIPGMPILVQMPSVEVAPTSGLVLGHAEYPELRRTDVLTVLWGYPPPDAEQRHPALVHNRYGRGQCIYSTVGFPLRTNDWASMMTRGRETTQAAAGDALNVLWTERLARNITGMLLGDRLLETNAPPGVEVTLNRRQGRYLVHLMSHYAGDAAHPAYAGDRLFLKDIALRLNTRRLGPLQRAWRLPQREPLQTTSHGAWTEIGVPAFAVHCLLEVE